MVIWYNSKTMEPKRSIALDDSPQTRHHGVNLWAESETERDADGGAGRIIPHRPQWQAQGVSRRYATAVVAPVQAAFAALAAARPARPTARRPTARSAV